VIPTLDTNILVYTADHRFPGKRAVSHRLLRLMQENAASLALQVLGEYFAIASSKLGQRGPVAAEGARGWLEAFPTFGSTSRSTGRALAEAATGRLSFWDANLLCAAEEAGCTHLLTEDMQDGYRLGGIEVVHVFNGDTLSDRARRLLGL